ncbi:acyltransferase family protein [Acrocarpospora catenulata]|uniref:acyltransferase family protein n=1 Tax=Acrocarpospora catenulata TaxID=2836182 RepID=UPI0027DEDBE4|nr:acyltransferase [Acrocarpospora catenulata]
MTATTPARRRRRRPTPPPAPPRPVPAPAQERPAAGGQPRLIELDLLRFVAAFAVMAFHYMAASKSIWGDFPTEIFAEVNRVTTLGILGVELFFLISGFVILMSAWGRSIGQFAASRIARLYPAYWFTVIALYVLYTYTDVQGFKFNLTFGDYLLNLTMFQEAFGVLHAGGVFWSLWVELKFYFLIAIVVLAGITLRRAMAFMWAWLVLVVVAEYLENDLLTEIVMPRQAPYFVAGMAFYLIYRFGPSVTRWGFVLVGYAFSVYAALERVQGRVDLVGIKRFPAPPTGVVIAITVIFLLMAAVALGWLRWIRWAPLTTVGALTYPLYLLHQNVSAVLIPGLRETFNPWLLTALTMGASILLAYLVFKLVDRPGQRLLRRILGGRRPARGE